MAAGLGALGHDRVDARGLQHLRFGHAGRHGDHLHARGVAARGALAPRIAQPDAEHRDALLHDHVERGVDRVGDLRGRLALDRQLKQGADLVELGLRARQRVARDRGRARRRLQGRVQPQVHAERLARVRADLGDLRAQRLGWLQQPGEDAEPAALGDLGDQLRSRDPAHARLQDWMLDGELRTQRGARATVFRWHSVPPYKR
jgi:hypothetical protein